VGGDVPDFEADPVAAGEVWLELECAGAEGAGVVEIDPLAIDLLAVAGDDFGESEGEGPCESDHQFRPAIGSELEVIAAGLAADGELRNQDLAGGDEEPAGTE